MHDAVSGTQRTDDPSGGNAPRSDHPPLGTVPLNNSHRIDDFCCARSPRVQDFLRNDAKGFSQNAYSKVYVWPSPNDPTEVWGYYTLAAASFARTSLINRHERHAPKGLPVPAVLIGYMGKADGVLSGFGSVLIYDAALRIAQGDQLGIWGVALDAENDWLVDWYTGLGFCKSKNKDQLPHLERFMYAPLSALVELAIASKVMPVPEASTGQI